MAQELLAIGVTDASSADVVLAVGDRVLVGLKYTGEPNRGVVAVNVKDDGTGYWRFGTLNSTEPFMWLYGPATYQLARDGVAGNAVGVFRADTPA